MIDYQKAITLLEQAASQISEVRALPSPFAYIQEMNDYGVTVKLIFFIDNYGRQFVVGDKVSKRALQLLQQNQVPFHRPTINVNALSKDEMHG